MSKKYILIDLCGTLFYSNTTFDFLDTTVKARGYHLLRRAMKYRIIRLANNAIYRIFHTDLLREKAISYLKGLTRSEIHEACTLFYDKYLVPRKIIETHKIMNRYMTAGYTPIIVSGTISPMAEVVAEQIGIDLYIASDIEFNNGICTGKLTSDRLNSKASALRQKDIRPPYGAVITDNRADLAVIRHSEASYIVTYNNRPYWQRKTEKLNNISFIDTGIDETTLAR